MIIEEVVRKIWSYPKGIVFQIIWKDKPSGLYRLDTFYETDNGLELDDPEYQEFHVALVESVKDKGIFFEIGNGEHTPIYIENTETGDVIWDLRK